MGGDNVFQDGMKVIKNSEMSDDEIREICNEYSTDPNLIKRILAGDVFTLLYSGKDREHDDTRFEEYDSEAPWVQLRVLQVYNSVLEGVEEL